MAYTITKEAHVGNRVEVLCKVVTDAASGTVPTGLGAIKAVSLAPLSMSSAAIKLSVSGGTVTVSNCTSGDEFYLVVIGSR